MKNFLLWQRMPIKKTYIKRQLPKDKSKYIISINNIHSDAQHRQTALNDKILKFFVKQWFAFAFLNVKPFNKK